VARPTTSVAPTSFEMRWSSNEIAS
jgi:hypothetical protein